MTVLCDGSRASYRRGCRCDQCRAANAEMHRRWRVNAAARADALGVSHGTTARYTNYGCRCDQCREANRLRLRTYRTEARTGVKSPPHGTQTGYTHYGCRCVACTEAGLAYYKRVSAKFTRVNARIAMTAVNHGKEWTGPELELLVRDDLTARQVAAMLGRSPMAVGAMRRKVRTGRKAAFGVLTEARVSA